MHLFGRLRSSRKTQKCEPLNNTKKHASISRYRVVACLVVCAILLCILQVINKRYEIFALNVLGSCEISNLTVLTWNVHCADSASVGRQREIAELIIRQQSDFVLLNEYNQDKCSCLDSILKSHYPYTEEIHSRARCGDIFYSKYELYNSGNVYVPGWGNYVNTIQSTICIGSDSIQIFGVHMASNNKEDSLGTKGSIIDCYRHAQESRCYEAHWIKETIKKYQLPSIVMGDFNDFSFSAPCDSLKVIGMKDSWWEGGFGYGTTFHDGWMRLRIDHIFHSPDLKLCGVEIIDTDLSDHNPVVARFKITH